ncbi:MAG TPA: response regulator [Phototrophicaceae bacterium]|jgi:CheY-like chemotaxis protein|nr:response regulator [Phototrophicaceae bacterium]
MALNNRTIYIIEDNPESLLLMQILLQRAGARVVIKRFDTNIIKHLKSFAPLDLILLDLTLAGSASGYDVYDWIRREKQFATTPIVAVSAADGIDVIPDLKTRGFYGFIAKPFDSESFVNQVKQLLAGESVWQSVG